MTWDDLKAEAAAEYKQSQEPASGPFRAEGEPAQPERIPMSREFIMRNIRPAWQANAFRQDERGGLVHSPSWGWDWRAAALFVGLELADAFRDVAAAIRERK